MRVCKKCGIKKPVEDFYKNNSLSGRDSSCKECRKKRVRKNYRENIEHYKEYERKRAMLPHRVEAREKYQATEQGKLAIYRGTKKYRRNNPIKQQAHNRVNHALVRGNISKPHACEQCGRSDKPIHAHHDDYLKQLEVRWLCPACHHQWHAKFGEAANADHGPLPRKYSAA
ncbi:hypothetical protein [Carnimonas bestiolae]|uniref:hypothetical protein n=1 Tax=Carnimonas bestiolae TaxID=3402172 RepID=UPI003EDC1F9E